MISKSICKKTVQLIQNWKKTFNSIEICLNNQLIWDGPFWHWQNTRFLNLLRRKWHNPRSSASVASPIDTLPLPEICVANPYLWKLCLTPSLLKSLLGGVEQEMFFFWWIVGSTRSEFDDPLYGITFSICFDYEIFFIQHNISICGIFSAI